MRSLIVDDELVSREKLLKIMDSFGQCTAVENGEDALRVATSQNPPDLILLDVIMPGMCGYEVCKKLKANRRTSNIPVIFISVRSGEDDEAEGLGLGAVDYITKPFSPSIVKARVRTHLELKRHRNRLEELVNVRTAELEKATKEMQAEIAERKRAEESLRESEEKYRNILESMEEGYYEVDLAGNFTFFNDALCKIRGYTRDELMGMNNREYMDAETAKKAYKAYNEVYRTGRCIKGYQWKTTRKDGTEGYVEVSVALIKDLKGKSIGFRGIVRDINERKQAEKEKARLEAQLQQSQKMEAVGTLAGGIAHDFNNILAIILGNAELASDDVPDWNPASNSLKEIRKASIRAKDMVHQLLAFSRKADEESQPIDLAPIIKESMKMLRSAIPTSVEFKQHISDDPCNVLGDATQINQIVMNLVINAADAMSKEGGLLEVTLAKIIFQEQITCSDWVLPPGAYVRLKVRDTGEGIEPKIIDRIFDPYYTTKEVGKGTGMGLSVVHGIVKRHGGGIRVESALGKGTVFEIYFPALKETAGKEKEPEGEIKGGSERILFVDDEKSMVNLNRQRLERLGYQVESTTKPEEALEWFKADPDQFDVIITDMTMPRMTGDRLAAEVLKIRPHMPVIICTGYSERMSAKKAAALGVRKYIEKPIDLRNLASAIREVLEVK